jgi:hypothetical protein
MIDIDALAESGLTNAFLKKVMTAEPEEKKKPLTTRQKADAKMERQNRGADTATSPTSQTCLEELPANPTLWDVRNYLETVIQGEINEGMNRCADDFDKWSAMDLAYTSAPIHPVPLNLMQLAMGYVGLQECASSIAKLSEGQHKNLFIRDGQKITGVNVPKLLEVNYNLVHSPVTRRVAALATEVYEQYPLLKYDPFSNTQTGRLVGDVMTQLAEQMGGAYGYRHDYEESLRNAALYTDCIKFKKSAWHTDKQRLPVTRPENGAAKAGRRPKKEFEDRIVREGVLFDIPHPTRRYYDITRPLSKLNQDIGPRWIGHWEAVPIGDIKNNKAYWNRDKIVMDSSVYDILSGCTTYFAQYYDRLSINPANCRQLSAALLAQRNDRNAQIGKYAELAAETPTIISNHYKQVIPKDVGLGRYPYPVWLRFVMVGYRTCVYAEIVGSAPASVNTYNGTDQLLNSQSFGLEALQWQQLLTNQLNELQHVMAQGLVRIFALNTHGMDKKEIEAVTEAIKNPDFSYLKDIVIKYDAEKFAQRGQEIRTITEKLTQIRVETGQKVTEIFGNIMNTIALSERMMFFSPQELGQVSPRTTSAMEQKAIKETTLGIRDYHLIGAKQQMEADKRIIHDSYMAFGSEDLEVPVAERYDQKVIEKAGFEIVDDGTGNPPDGLYTIRGKKLSLFYNYTFSTRQTDDTPTDAAVAQGIAQVFEVISKDPVISANTTLEQRYELANSLFAIIAPGVFKLRVPAGVDGKQTQGGQVEAIQKQLQQILPDIGKQIQMLAKTQQDMAAQIQANEASIQALSKATTKLAGTVTRAAETAEPRAPATRRGQIDPATPVGNGAPPLRGVIAPRPVPILGR